MIELPGPYPVYKIKSENILVHRALISYTVEQLLEIANVFYYVNEHCVAGPSIFSRLFNKLFRRHRIMLTLEQRALHKAVHHAAVNAIISLEEAERCEIKGDED